MSAIDDWKRVTGPDRWKILDALESPGVIDAVAKVLDPPNTCNELTGSELTHAETRDLATAIAALREIA